MGFWLSRSASLTNPIDSEESASANTTSSLLPALAGAGSRRDLSE